MSVQGKTETEVRDAAKLFDEILCVVESKQLAPVLHTQVRRLRISARRWPRLIRWPAEIRAFCGRAA